MNTSAPVFAKFLVCLLPDGSEQAVRFPTSRQHASVAREIGLPVVSAGFCLDGDFWVGGESETLKISSRGDQDNVALRRMLQSPARETYDLIPEQEPQTFDLDAADTDIITGPAISFP